MVELRTLGLELSEYTAPFADAQGSVASRSLTNPPTGVALGSRYIVPLYATGAWSGHTHKIAVRQGVGWQFVITVPGMSAWVDDERAEFIFDGNAWTKIGTQGSGDGTTQPGTSTTGRGINTWSNKRMPGRTTTHDNARACDIAVAKTPVEGGAISVYVNGVGVSDIGDGAKVGVACYFSGDGGFTPRLHSAVQAGDCLYWNGSIAGWQISANTDVIDFVYEVP